MKNKANLIKMPCKIDTVLSSSDFARLDLAAKQENKKRSEVIREGLLWYLDNRENLRQEERDGKIAAAIRYATDKIVKALLGATDRICGMLARQGAEIGTLYELTWRSSSSEEAKELFEVAANTAKQRQRKRLEKDEKDLAERNKNLVVS